MMMDFFHVGLNMFTLFYLLVLLGFVQSTYVQIQQNIVYKWRLSKSSVLIDGVRKYTDFNSNWDRFSSVY